MIRFIALSSVIVLATLAPAQQPAAPPSQSSSQGQVLFHRNEGQPQPDRKPDTRSPHTPEAAIQSITEVERSALGFTARDLDLHLTPATSHLAARARFTVRNTSSAPLKRLVLQLSSALSFESIGSPAPLSFTQHTIATDADHTGEATEALVTLPQPIAPGDTLTLTALYSGDLRSSGQRLIRIWAPPEQALRADWDRIAPDIVALRGFGNVIWYPVCSPPLFLGDGAKLFQAVGLSRRQQAASTLHVRLSIEYVGEPPVDAFLNGKRLPLEHVSEEPNALVADSHGVATADFPAAAIGFRTPSLFVTWNAQKPTDNQLLSVITERPEAITPYAVAADNVAPLLRDWLGPAPLSPLVLLDHSGQPFEDDAFLALPLTVTDAQQIAPSLVHSLTHAWFRSSLPWLDEGVPQFMSLLASESADGRDKTLAELHQLITPLTLIEPEGAPAAPRQNAGTSPASPKPDHPAEPESGESRSLQESLQAKLRGILPGPPDSYSSSAANPDSSSSSTSRESNEPAPVLPSTQPPPPGQPGQSLIDAHDEVYYRAKAAAVLFMLRSITGDTALKQALQTYRNQVRHAEHEDPHGFQHVLEQTSHKDLAQLFDDWVYNDRGLADLSIVSVTPRSLPARNGKDVSWLVAVEVHNAGSVTADVPITVRSGALTATERVLVPAQSTVSTRVVFEGIPQEVILNDGTVPETTASMHLFHLRLPGAATP